jgi:penicillin V acylase-like amidase (Ntn superfamily)
MNKNMKYILIIFLFFTTKCYSECTSFCLISKDTILFGNNLDWYAGDGLVIVNKRNVSKKGCWFSSKPSWTSKYGSITINQFGREFPSRGMNEVGLVVGEMTLSETEFPNPDSRSPISLLQWIQYQLDNCATIEEVIETDLRIRIDQDEYHSHFLVADSSGNCVTMEWLNGQLVYHAHETLPIKVLTNSNYASCIEYYNNHSSPPSSDFSSEARFYRAAEMIKNYDPHSNGPLIACAFNILRSVGPSGWTKWSLVFDIKNLRFYFWTSSNNNIRYVDFFSFNFSCDIPVKIFDLNNQLSGDVENHFIGYDSDVNRALIINIFEKTGPYIGYPPDWVKDTMATYPEKTTCIPEVNIEHHNSFLPEFKLFQNYPNPFNPTTKIKYNLGKPCYTTLKIYNLSGHEIETLVDGYQMAGTYQVNWQTRRLPSGIYFYKMKAGVFSETKKLILQK